MQNHHSIERAVRFSKEYVDLFEKRAKKNRTKTEHMWAITLAVAIIAISITFISQNYWMIPLNLLNLFILAAGIYQFRKRQIHSEGFINEIKEAIGRLQNRNVTDSTEAEEVLSKFETELEEISLKHWPPNKKSKNKTI